MKTISAVFFLVSAVVSTACEAGPQARGADSTQAVADPSRDFAYAMQKREPLAMIEGGADIPVCDSPSGPNSIYTDAVDYAQSMGSYSLIIWNDGECHLEAYFPPFDRDTRAESASMHKSIVGILVAAAIADGYIKGPDARIGDYIQEWADDARGDITLRQLLTMSSGLAPASREGGADSEAMRYIVGPVDVRSATLGRQLRDVPGTVFHYQAINTQLLLMVLESATGMNYADYASERLWQPLEAADAYVWNYTGPIVMPRAHMSFLAPARDWLKLGLLLKNYGRYGGSQIIPRALIDEATEPSAANPNYAWQIWLGEDYQAARYYNQERTGLVVSMSKPFAVDDMIFFDGFGGQRVYVSRREDLVIVRQGDSRRDWDDAMLPNLVLSALHE